MKKKYILLLIPFILYVALLGVLPQMEPDEARYSLIPSAMNETGNYVTPHIKNTIYLEKPPLVYWMTSISFRIFGENDFSARLVTGLCAWGCIWLVFLIGRHFRDEKTGLYAAAVLTISVFPFILGRINILDMPLTLFLCLAIWLGYLYLQQDHKKHLLYLSYFCCALAFLTKGVIGVVFPFAILVFWLVWARRWRQIVRLVSPVGMLIFVAVVSPWLYLAQRENQDFLWFFFVREHFLRFTTKMHGKTEPFYYFVPILVVGMFPWLIYLVRAWQQNLKTYLFQKDENKLLMTWFLFIFIFYSASSSKLAPYIAPVFLPIALFAGNLFRYHDESMSQLSGKRLLVQRLLLGVFVVIAMAAVFLPPFLKPYSDASRGLVIMTSDAWWFYVAPVLAVIALLAFLPDWISRRRPEKWFLTIYVLSCLLLAGILFPVNDFLAPYRSALAARDAIAEHLPPGKLLYQYRVNFYGIDFYNKIRTPVVEDFGELIDGIAKMPRDERKEFFLTPLEFVKKIEREREIYCITQHQDKLNQLKSRYARTEILWDNGAFYLLRIQHEPKE